MTRYAISDIHGCNRTFQELLKTIHFSKDDQLFLLGDYVDRGPDSNGVISFILDLQKQGYDVRCLKGNHEEMWLRALSHEEEIDIWMRNGGEATMQSYLAHDPNGIPSEHIDFLNSLPLYLESDNFLMVHAGIDFKHPNPLQDPFGLLWSRNWQDKIDRNWLGDKIVIHGHTPTPRILIEFQLEVIHRIPAIDIDAGCVYTHAAHSGLGYLCAFNMDQRSLVFQKNSEKAI